MFTSSCHKHPFRTIRKLQLSVRWFHFDLKISFCTFFYSCKKQSRPHHPVCSCRANLVQSCQMFDPGGKATDETDIKSATIVPKRKDNNNFHFKSKKSSWLFGILPTRPESNLYDHHDADHLTYYYLEKMHQVVGVQIMAATKSGNVIICGKKTLW